MSVQYPDILKIKEKEAILDQNMKSYTTLYQDYLQLVKDQIKKCNHNPTTTCLKNVGKINLRDLRH